MIVFLLWALMVSENYQSLFGAGVWIEYAVYALFFLVPARHYWEKDRQFQLELQRMEAFYRASLVARKPPSANYWRAKGEGV